jgi:hypothetical protein
MTDGSSAAGPRSTNWALAADSSDGLIGVPLWSRAPITEENTLDRDSSCWACSNTWGSVHAECFSRKRTMVGSASAGG